jgi:hypothetical protein
VGRGGGGGGGAPGGPPRPPPPPPPPPDPAPQLVQLRQAEGIRPVDDQRVGIRDIQPGFDDRRAQQHIHFAPYEGVHCPLQLVLVHLPMADADARFGDKGGQRFPDRTDRLHPVMEVKNLSAPLDLAQDRLAHQFFAVRADARDDRHPLLGRRINGRDIPDAGERKVQRAGNGSGGEGEHVHLGAQLLEILLVRDSEALLLVDHHQPQIVEGDVALEQAVGADKDIQFPRGQLFEDPGLFSKSPEPRQHFHTDREGRQALREGLKMLLRKDGRGHEHRNLDPVHHRLEGGAQGNLGLPVPDVAAD